ncbi:2-dehydropantoate 2-reductase [Ornithinibacillus sp. L9]|uniref:2-dehydropantoate 2-reductase n=1 Tax=Ornithinibacillus caprae TaxID=2678566 RepID=A0A6N8FMZ9_9BACI|nr:2-dehydropantoate 2-reductase [Ornithinibacillus caprae]MUK89784.1 2-dehydropantoate 2-reductase [Ornithinibacillus caprae]
MKIVVFGAGALGVYFGARFEEAGADVTFLVREKRAKQIHENGLAVNSPKGDYTFQDPTIITDVSEIESADLVLLSVKGYHLEGALESLKELQKKGAYVLPVLNGMEHIPLLQNELGKDFVLGGLSFIMATLNDHGHVEHNSEFHQVVFGALEPTHKAICQQLEELTENANVDVVNSDRILIELWKKYMFINAFSGITTATNLPIGPIRSNQETFRIAEMVLQEMRIIANAYHVEVTEKDVEAAKTQLLNIQDDGTSSMHQDRRKGLILELEHLHGGAIRLAKAKGLEVPYIEAIYGIIKPFEDPKNM